VKFANLALAAPWPAQEPNKQTRKPKLPAMAGTENSESNGNGVDRRATAAGTSNHRY
jgi:hypothetical protein